jgi:acyl-CoA synthetase (AMP-forming)/AMP-acid ligase II
MQLFQLSRRWFSTLQGFHANFFWQPNSPTTVPMLLERWAEKRPHDPFFYFEGKTWSIGAFNSEVDRHAHIHQQQGIQRGDVVALIMENQPAYLFHFFALGKLGAVASLINPRLKGPALVHALESCKPKGVVIDAAELPHYKLSVVGDMPWQLWLEGDADAEEYGDSESVPRWADLLRGQSSEAFAHTAENRLSDVVAYIYTSGTTGMPKPAVVKHHRLWRAGKILGGLAQITSDDCIYNCLPLYHANAMVIGTSSAITHRARFALARKFSARRFWQDCRSSEATVILYIGEICRYLHNQDPSPSDRDHQVRRIVGNGMRGDIWKSFCERFGIEKVVEFYGSTEGNAETANLLNKEGSCGVLLPFKMALCRYDVETETLVRDKKGFCVPTKANEPGLLLGAIRGKNEFAGYRDKKASNAKVLKDVFKRGDRWFNTGDLLYRDHLRRIYFADRLGDTFRWKGENVATQEVAEVFTELAWIAECTVYGVKVPGAEGRTGMAALVLRDGVSFEGTEAYQALAQRLPSYALPRFIRHMAALPLTATFKYRKNELQNEGFDQGQVNDPLYVWDPAAKTYLPLGEKIQGEIIAGRYAL